jgi:hypothetical protein
VRAHCYVLPWWVTAFVILPSHRKSTCHEMKSRHVAGYFLEWMTCEGIGTAIITVSHNVCYVPIPRYGPVATFVFVCSVLKCECEAQWLDYCVLLRSETNIFWMSFFFFYNFIIGYWKSQLKNLSNMWLSDQSNRDRKVIYYLCSCIFTGTVHAS